MKDNVCLNCGVAIVGPDNVGSHDNPNTCVRNLRSDLADQRARLEKTETELSRFSEWIVSRGGTVRDWTPPTDHACAQCIPGGPIVKFGFTCVYHEAKYKLMVEASRRSRQIRHCEGLRCVHPHDGPCNCPCEGCTKAGDEVR